MTFSAKIIQLKVGSKQKHSWDHYHFKILNSGSKFIANCDIELHVEDNKTYFGFLRISSSCPTTPETLVLIILKAISASSDVIWLKKYYHTRCYILENLKNHATYTFPHPLSKSPPQGIAAMCVWSLIMVKTDVSQSDFTNSWLTTSYS